MCNVTGEYYGKWNKPGGEGQIPYDLTFNRNIINRRKSKQNIARDIEVKNNLTIARGEGEGIVGRRAFRNYYKGHMDKTNKQGREGGLAGMGGQGREKMQTTVIEQQ